MTKRTGTEFASADEVLSFLNADRCRLVYRLRRQTGIETHRDRAQDRAKGSSLFLLEYDRSQPFPAVYEYPDLPELKSFGPLLSPDGSRIVYNHSFDATDMYILPFGGEAPQRIASGANPHWCRDETDGSTYVVYRDRNGVFGTIPQGGSTFRIRIDVTDQPVGEPETIAAYGFGGGMSTNGRYLCTAFQLVCSMDRQTGAISAPLGTVVQDPSRANQCCCPSMAPDGTGRMMVLRWPHSRFSVMGWDGADITHYPIPEGVGEWQTPEWSTHPDFATASAMNDDLIYDIVLVSLKDGRYLQITKDGGYVHAHLWIQSVSAWRPVSVHPTQRECDRGATSRPRHGARSQWSAQENGSSLTTASGGRKGVPS